MEGDRAEGGIAKVAFFEVCADEVCFDNIAIGEISLSQIQVIEVAAAQQAFLEADIHGKGIDLGKIDSHQFTALEFHTLQLGKLKGSQREIAVFEDAVIKGAIKLQV